MAGAVLMVPIVGLGVTILFAMTSTSPPIGRLVTFGIAMEIVVLLCTSMMWLLFVTDCVVRDGSGDFFRISSKPDCCDKQPKSEPVK